MFSLKPEQQNVTLITLHDRPLKTELGEYYYLIECADCSYTSYQKLIENSSFSFRYLGSFDIKTVLSILKEDNQMKKWMVLMLAATLCLSLAACAQSAAPAVETPAEEQTEMEYISPEGWAVCYNPTMMESIEGDGYVDFVYLDDPENKATIRFVEGKQPEELLYEVCEAWECDMEDIDRTEGFFPGTTDKWGYWRVMNPQEDGLSRTAIAGEFNGGVLLIEDVLRITGDDEMDYRVTGALEMVVDSLRYDRFDAQTMYDYIPGVYAAEQDGFVYTVELNEDHTGVLHFQDDVNFVWGSISLTGDDFVYEYTIEGDALMLNYDGVWMQFDRQ